MALEGGCGQPRSRQPPLEHPQDVVCSHAAAAGPSGSAPKRQEERGLGRKLASGAEVRLDVLVEIGAAGDGPLPAAFLVEPQVVLPAIGVEVRAAELCDGSCPGGGVDQVAMTARSRRPASSGFPSGSVVGMELSRSRIWPGSIAGVLPS